MDDALMLWCAIWATWRLTALLHEDTIMQPLRHLMGEHIEIVETTKQEIVTTNGVPSLVPVKAYEQQIKYSDTFFGHLIKCFRCVSVWAAGAIVVLYIVFPPLLVLLGLSGMAIFIREYMKV